MGQHADDQRSLLNQTNSSVLQFASCICLRVNVADFFQFQTAFQADCIINATANEEHIVCIGILRSKPLDALFIFQSFLHLLRESQQFRNIVTVLFFSDFFSNLCELNRQAVHGRKLCAVCLGCSNRNFRASKCVKHLVCFTGNAAAHYIDDCHCGNAIFFCQTQCCQCICCLTRLADNDYKCFLIERHFTIAELRCKFHTHRNIRYIFQHILSSHAHMPCRATGNNIDLLKVFNFVLGDLHTG